MSRHPAARCRVLITLLLVLQLILPANAVLPSPSLALATEGSPESLAQSTAETPPPLTEPADLPATAAPPVQADTLGRTFLPLATAGTPPGPLPAADTPQAQPTLTAAAQAGEAWLSGGSNPAGPKGSRRGNGNHLRVDAYRLLRPWNAGTATWNYPWLGPGANATGVDRAGGPVASAIVRPQDVGTCLTWDVTALAQGWAADPDANHGLILRADDPSIPYGGAAGYEFATAEYWQTALRPRLQVLVDVTTPAPASPTPTATAKLVDWERVDWWTDRFRTTVSPRPGTWSRRSATMRVRTTFSMPLSAIWNRWSR